MKVKKLNEKSFFTILYVLLGIILLIPLFSKDLTLIEKGVMFFSQYVSFFASILFFKELFKDEDEYKTFFGVLLIAVSPYRFFISFNEKEKLLSLAVSIIPLYAFFVLKAIKNAKLKIVFYILAGIALALIGLLHFPILTVLIFVSITLVFVYKAPLVLLTIALGFGLSIPFTLDTLKYLLFGGFDELNYSCASIMPYGYRFGSYFNTFLNIDSNPGFGIGLLICLLAGVWNTISDSKKVRSKTDYYMFIMGILFMLTALRKFPWEYVQRIASPLLRYVGIWRTPTFFAGLAGLFLSVIGAKAIGGLGHRNEQIANAEDGKGKKNPSSKDNNDNEAIDVYELVKNVVIFVCMGIYILQSCL